MKIFEETGIINQSAHFGWQKNNDITLCGLHEGYKDAADELVDIVMNSGGNTRILDTYIFPIMFLYRHSIELLLKRIYLRAYGTIPNGGHDLLKLWESIETKIIKDIINSDEFIEQAKEYKDNFKKYSLDNGIVDEIKKLLEELQEANQKPEEKKASKKQIDQKAEVWRYLMSVDEHLFFSCLHSIDYETLKEGFEYLYSFFDYLYFIVEEYLSS